MDATRVTRRRVATAACTAGILAGTAAGAAGFSAGIKENQPVHTALTQRALRCEGTTTAPDCIEPRTLAQLAGDLTAGTRSAWFGAVTVPDRSTLLADGSYHCDNGDWLPLRGYPQSAAAAAANLIACRTRVQEQIEAAVTRAGAMLDSAGMLRPDQLATSCSFVGRLSGTAKCNAIESFGIALHTAQDFYAHSNWVDRPDPRRPLSATNPPGLGRATRAPFMDLRVPVAFPVRPTRLISGCFRGPVESVWCNYGGTLGTAHARVKHAALAKDDKRRSWPRGYAGRVRGDDNWSRAVTAALQDTSDKWAYLRERILATYGTQKGAIIVCALANDDAATACNPCPPGITDPANPLCTLSGHDPTKDPPIDPRSLPAPVPAP